MRYPFLIALLLLAGCQITSPAMVTGCSVRADGPDQVMLSADVLDKTFKGMRMLHVRVESSGAANSTGTPSGAVIEYGLKGPFLPGRWAHREALQAIRSDGNTLDRHLGKVSNCRVSAAEFDDGTVWTAPSEI